MTVDGTAQPEDPTTADEAAALRAAKDDESGVQSNQHFIHYKDKDNKKRRLAANMPFLLYWCKGTGDTYYPLGLWEGKDFMPKSSVSKSGVIQCRFVTADGDIDNHTIKNAELQYRVGPTGSWSRPVQRKGKYHYLAHTGSSDSMRKIINWNIYPEQIRFALRFDISGAGDSWISENEYTGSIRMRDSSGDRAWLAAVRYGTTWDDPFGTRTSFSSRSWQNDLSRG
ncbi:hypothetical protein [Streptoalloteichus hindustanus]|uniref:Uncharacterized protein n=1 Tax=Streptoalloteichus hindustanus TaxID=2017 RepID=A0A1M5PX11_STRHI|nr:hypothetical protein [Streptoalloteichus hindustanus]SHH06182.1 hypothetical protein SAMN05444320_12028 [Streptoalloteichus hindustanus]